MGEALAGWKRTHRCTEVTENMVGQVVTVMGWVNQRRNLGKLIFIALRDRTGVVQAVVDGNTASTALFEKTESIGREYVVAVRGTVRNRTEGNINTQMKTGAIEIIAEDVKILSESEIPPFQVQDTGVKEDMRLKYRYLDLRRPELQESLMTRHNAAQYVRRFLSDNGFLEIETPFLTKSTPEGARDYLVPSRIHPGNFYALPQSPQLFKQLLMVSGFDRYFQIVKCFRDEDLRADRQPEFTQIDIEMSFVDVEDVIEMNEKFMQGLFKDILNVDVQIPMPRMTFADAMERYGSDKPDIRFGMELQNITEVVKGFEFAPFVNALEAGGSVRGINANGCAKYSRKQLDALGEVTKTFGCGLFSIVVGENGELKSAMSKTVTPEQLGAIVERLEGKPGDLLLMCAGNNDKVFSALGTLRCHIAEKEGLARPDDFKFLWVTEFPMFEYSEEDDRLVARHHPFTSPMDEDMHLFDTEPLKMRAKAYDIVLNGFEIGGGSIRIYRQDVQNRVFEALGFTKESAYERFGFLLDAFKYGPPPHGGIAYGFDRLIMLLTFRDAIRDVIAFPKVKDASCPMTEAPNLVEDKQLKELGIALTVNPQEN